MYGRVEYTPFPVRARTTIDVNYFGTMCVTDAFLPLLRASDWSPRIVNLASSVGSLRGSAEIPRMRPRATFCFSLVIADQPGGHSSAGALCSAPMSSAAAGGEARSQRRRPGLFVRDGDGFEATHAPLRGLAEPQAAGTRSKRSRRPG